jgi:tetratricopeptide (TPR) repeat protein
VSEHAEAIPPEAFWQGAMGAAEKAAKAGDLKTAAAGYHAALLNAEKLGPDDPRLAATLHHLARAYDDMGESENAQKYATRALAIAKKHTDGDCRKIVASVSMLLGAAAFARADAKLAARHWSRAFARMREDGQPEALMAASNLAAAELALGNREKAEKIYRQTLTAIKKTLGEENPQFGAALHGLAETYREQGKHAEAEPVYKWSIAVLQRPGAPAEMLKEALRDYAKLLRASGREADAAKLEAAAT